MWILLTGLSPGHVLLGALVALIVSRSMLSLKVEPPRVRVGWAMVRLAAIVLADIVRSNIAVAKVILFNPPERHSDFIELPTELRSPYALAMPALIITATPGSLWVQRSEEPTSELHSLMRISYAVFCLKKKKQKNNNINKTTITL